MLVVFTIISYIVYIHSEANCLVHENATNRKFCFILIIIFYVESIHSESGKKEYSKHDRK